LFRIGFSEISATAFSENMASRRVMEKCGMKPNGRTRLVSLPRQASPLCHVRGLETKSD
jgi:RimJ/RimL family protein N-acetyltransferase